MRAPDDSLQLLLLAVAAQDRVAFRKLYDVSSSKLFGTVLRIVRSRPAAEEILQDVYLRVWQSAASYSPETASPMVWLNSIARNRSIDVLRQKSFVQASAETNDWYEQVAEDRDRESDMVEIAALRRCLQRIEPQARACVLLAYYEGFSREELASRFDRPVNTIKTWLHRSIGTLRACLDGAAS